MAKKILLVDDDRGAVAYLAAVLENNGYKTERAYNGKEGLRKVEEFAPDLIVLDVMMPEKSGLLLCSELKKDEKYKHIPILMVSGVGKVLEELDRPEEEPAGGLHDTMLQALKKKVRELRQAGLITPDMFVDKPVDPDSFVVKVRQFLGD